MHCTYHLLPLLHPLKLEVSSYYPMAFYLDGIPLKAKFNRLQQKPQSFKIKGKIRLLRLCSGTSKAPRLGQDEPGSYFIILKEDYIPIPPNKASFMPALEDNLRKKKLFCHLSTFHNHPKSLPLFLHFPFPSLSPTSSLL